MKTRLTAIASRSAGKRPRVSAGARGRSVVIGASAGSHYGRKRERAAWGDNQGARRSEYRASSRGEQRRVAPHDARSLRVAAENAHHFVAESRRVPDPPSPPRLALDVFGGATRMCP